MSYKVLARKWRPAHFREMIGQEGALRALHHALEKQRLHHAYLFSGVRGVGKTTVARIFVRCLNCERGISPQPCDSCSACKEIRAGNFPDLIEVDAASRTQVADMRELLEDVQYMPVQGRYKIYLIDEVHMLSGHSFNALLKTLEEPPEHVKFLLATTDPDKLPATVLSRCLRFHLRLVPATEIAEYLQTMLKSEEISAEAVALQLLAASAGGSVRDAVSLADQAIAYCQGVLTEQDVREMLGMTDQGRVLTLLRALAAGDGQILLREVRQLAERGCDFEGILTELLSCMHEMAVLHAVPELARKSEEDPERMDLRQIAADLRPEQLQMFYQAGVVGRRDFHLAPDPQSALEMTLLRMLSFMRAEPAMQSDEPSDEQSDEQSGARSDRQSEDRSNSRSNQQSVQPPNRAARETVRSRVEREEVSPDTKTQLPPARQEADFVPSAQTDSELVRDFSAEFGARQLQHKFSARLQTESVRPTTTSDQHR